MMGVESRAPHARAGSARPARWSALIWHSAGAITILLVPSRFRLGQPFWTLAPDQTAQVLAMVAAYIALAFLVSSFARFWARLGASVIGGIACFGAAYGMLTLNPELPVSRALVILSAGVGIALVWAEPVIRRHQILASGTLALLVALVLMLLGRLKPERDPSLEWTVTTVSQAVTVRVQQELVGRPESDGGAIAALSDGYLVVTGDGRFHRLRLDSAADTLLAEPVEIASPINREEYLASLSDNERSYRLRATDLLVDTASDPPHALAAHQYWNLEEACFTLRVSAMPLDSMIAGTGVWYTLFESSPCITPSPGIEDIQSGGRLAIDSGRRLLLTVGDFGYDGLHLPDFAQSLDADYGKVFAIGAGEVKQMVSLGHRNPQGLAVDREGRIWLTEHGPKGGDEINLVTDGGNYGWPLATYGSDYDAFSWPGAAGRRDHGPYIEPVYAFMPSIGINQVIEVRPGAFGGWEGDLLVASLGGQSLYRVRTSDGRAVFTERIRIDSYRIRDLEQGADGRIVLLTDDGDVLSLRAGAKATGEFLYANLCAACHQPGPGTFVGAPDLAGVVDRPIASTSWPGYSPVLERLDGTWTEERLDAFLRDPDSVAPGNRMRFRGIEDAAERQLVIDYLVTRE